MKFDFPNARGQMLSGRLVFPSSEPKVFALFAHCFTCSKDIVAANVIARGLADQGVAVLRFDFTGLGNSEGDFANTNFSSNVEDLVRASEQLRQKHMAPQLLVGHSLGGAAVLKAASRPEMQDVKAIATLGAPSSVKHIVHHFQEELETIKREGEAKVLLAGRSFRIQKQFIDDINTTDVLAEVSKLKKALLVMHSPTDDTVSIDHASEIFTAAKHPKSFVSLDDAGHLLMKRRDAQYAADVISSWAKRFLPDLSEEKSREKTTAPGAVVVQSRPGERFTHDVRTTKHHLIADEPAALKGADRGMNPYELLLSSLGACTSMTLKMYAERKGWNLEAVKVELSHRKIHADDCAECETQSGQLDEITKRIEICGDLDTEQRKRLMEIAERCPVNRTLQSEVRIIGSHKNLE